MECGKITPPHEVNYEQSIVELAATYLCDLYPPGPVRRNTHRRLRIQLAVLDLFHFQPDYHMNEVHPATGRLLVRKKRMLRRYLPHY